MKILNITNSKEFILVMNFLRIAFFIWAIGMTIYIIKEIEAVKILLYDPCAICMNKTGCQCFCIPLKGG